MIRVNLKRVYEQAEAADGTRLLVERLWPRGIRKERALLDGWLKEVAPSGELCKWYDHNPAKWNEFCRRYFEELAGKAEVLDPILEAAEKGNVTLVFAAKDPKFSIAWALKEYLRRFSPRPAPNKAHPRAVTAKQSRVRPRA
jgi:uncharacterized protein YeaO (DUF488 family)